MTSVRSRWFALLTVCCLAVAPEVALAQAGAITGTVTEAQAGVPVANAQIRAVAADGSIPTAGLSGENGQFRLSNLQPGTYSVVFNRVGYQQQRISGVTVTAGGTTTVNVAMQTTALTLDVEVVTASRRQEKALEAPASVAVISAERVEEQPALQPTEHLKGVPGIDYAQTGLMTTTVVARGFSNVFSTSLLAITDNRYTNVPSLRVNSSFLMPAVNDDIERVEVLLGPGSALYGPNAANGVMHVITRSPLNYQGTTVSLGGGERDVLTASLRHAGIAGERFGYKVTGQWMQGREWEFVDLAEMEARQENPALPARDFDLRRWTGEVRGDYRVSDDWTIIGNVGRAAAVNAIEMTPFGAAQAKDWEYSYAQARLVAPRWFFQGFINTSNAGNTFLLRTGEPIVDESRLWAAQAQHTLPIGERQTFIAGVDYQYTDPRTGGTIHGRFEEDDDSRELGGYIQSETRLSPQFDIILAARLDNHSRVEGDVFSPRAALVYRPFENQNFRVTYNRAFGTPLNSQLFLDLFADQIGPLPYAFTPQPQLARFEIRGIGNARGLTYARDCVGGICVRSPFPATGEVAPDPALRRAADATQFWSAATNILFAATEGAVDIRMIPAPTSAQVGTVLRQLNPHPEGAFFETVSIDDLTDIAPLQPSISNTVEVGYKGILANRLSLSVDVWHQQRKNFTSAALMQTPNIFFEMNSLAAYLSNFMPQQQAGQIAAAMAGLEGNPVVRGIPLATVGFAESFAADPSLYLTYRNYGDVSLWGSDLAFEALLTDFLTLTGTYSWLSDDTFRTADIFGNEADVVLNAPANKGSVGLRWGDRNRGLTINSMVRFVDGFPMNSGVYVGNVESYSVVDLGFTWRIPRMQGSLITLSAQNIFDREHQQFIGAPAIGRLITGRLTYSF